ncbi:hypothetical protein Tco_1044664 [Tanacetum coccineum]|uniref:Uncharacterized protein n=1 Tax=Tanacetum coccineum TaxID=301880 RepID=A0ABQ5GRM6_9ASTR
MIVETIHVNFDELPAMASDHDSFGSAPQFLCSMNTSTRRMKLYPSLLMSLIQNTTQSTTTPFAAESPQMIVHNTPDPITPSAQVHAEEDNNIQADDAVFDAYKFINPFVTPITKFGKSVESHYLIT